MGLDGTLKSLTEWLKGKVKLVPLNYPRILGELAKEEGLTPAQTSRYVSSILVGALTGILSLDLEHVKYSFERRFKGREKLIRQNMKLVGIVAGLTRELIDKPIELDPPYNPPKEFIVASGNEIVGMAKIVGGVRFESYYPITPAADECFFLESYENLEVEGESLGGILVFQTEDEIAAITSALGASLTGVRASTATSGPGFSLMVEGLGWAGICETPIVITYYQRGGPSTGQPTRGSQSDLLSVLYASHGEFPRIILTSGDHLEAFYDTIEAFNLAEKYQVPVIHLLDKFLANSIATVPLPDFEKIRIVRGEIVKGGEGYKRFSLEKPVSPRSPIGFGEVTWYTGNEHDEYGHISEEPDLRIKMYDKRMAKLELIDSEIPQDKRFKYYGGEDADLLLIGWGYVKNPCLEALYKLESKGVKAAYLHLKMFSPFPEKAVREVVGRFGENVVAVEHNYLAQAGRIVASSTRLTISKSIVKYTGRPIYTQELVSGVLRVLRGEDRVVLSYGA